MAGVVGRGGSRIGLLSARISPDLHRSSTGVRGGVSRVAGAPPDVSEAAARRVAEGARAALKWLEAPVKRR